MLVFLSASGMSLPGQITYTLLSLDAHNIVDVIFLHHHLYMQHTQMEECATENLNSDGAAGAVCLFFHFQTGRIPEVVGERGKTRGHCLLRLLGEHGAVSLAVHPNLQDHTECHF